MQLRQAQAQFFLRREAGLSARGGLASQGQKGRVRLIESRGREPAQATHRLQHVQALRGGGRPFQATGHFHRLLQRVTDLPCAEVKLFGQSNLFIPFEQTTFAEGTKVQ